MKSLVRHWTLRTCVNGSSIFCTSTWVSSFNYRVFRAFSSYTSISSLAISVEGCGVFEEWLWKRWCSWLDSTGFAACRQHFDGWLPRTTLSLSFPLFLPLCMRLSLSVPPTTQRSRAESRLPSNGCVSGDAVVIVCSCSPYAEKTSQRFMVCFYYFAPANENYAYTAYTVQTVHRLDGILMKATVNVVVHGIDYRNDAKSTRYFVGLKKKQIILQTIFVKEKESKGRVFI